MEVKIGVQNAPRELTIDADIDAEHVEKLVAEAVSGGGVLTLSDAKGRRIVVPAEKIATEPKTVKSSGSDEPAGSMSFTILVPASVPSLNHSSQPRIPSVAVKSTPAPNVT